MDPIGVVPGFFYLEREIVMTGHPPIGWMSIWNAWNPLSFIVLKVSRPVAFKQHGP
jgi:hypothetical protein